MRWSFVWLLVKAFMQGTKPLATYWKQFGGKRNTLKGKILQSFLVIILFLTFLMLEVMFGINYYSYQTLGMMIDIPDLGMFLACLAGFLFIFIFSSASTSSVLYWGSDEMFVISLPVTEKELVASRLIVSYLGNILFYAIVVFPALVASAFVNGVTLLLVIGGVLLLIIGPFVPLALGMLISSLILRLTKGRRYRLFEELISMVFLVGLTLVMTSSFTRNLAPGDTFAIDYQAMLATMADKISGLYKSLPIFAWQGRGVFSLRYLLLNISTSLVLAGLFISFVAHGFNTCFSYAQEGNGVHRHSIKQSSRRRLPAEFSLMKREKEVILHSSAFIFELVGELFVPIILIGVYALTGVLGEMEGIIQLATSSPYFLYGVFGLVNLLSGISMLSATSVSRQGALFEMDKTYPLEPEIFIRAKLYFHLVLVFPTTIIYLVLALLYFKLGPGNLVWMIPLSFGIILSSAVFALSIDYGHPMLDWTLAKQAIKSNLNGVFGMLGSFLLVLFETALLLLPLLFGFSPLWGKLLALVCIISIGFFSFRRSIRKATEALKPS
ncbi:hypothetical protein [uncultured Sphaerochaeta sp.]|uniref:hypothetical protein n=1 Tax=uncultured Sphaerochaeta sp. TaxID=886478 RepID=UPI002A0A8E3A|nr:hypothetical protein [uncultured Sphaerochaeta sp.]